MENYRTFEDIPKAQIVAAVTVGFGMIFDVLVAKKLVTRKAATKHLDKLTERFATEIGEQGNAVVLNLMRAAIEPADEDDRIEQMIDLLAKPPRGNA